MITYPSITIWIVRLSLLLGVLLENNSRNNYFLKHLLVLFDIKLYINHFL
jgi:hypothetical protein